MVWRCWRGNDLLFEIDLAAGYIIETVARSSGDLQIEKHHAARLPTCNVATKSLRVCHPCLRVLKNASREVGQKYAVTTFDLGLCMKAYSIIWKSSDFYDDHIVMIGSFHLICAYLKMIGKKMNESGLADVLLEVGVISVGFINGAISGKSYSRAINCHKVMVKSLERLLLDRYLETRCLKGLPGDLPKAINRINHIINERTSENLHAANKALANFLKEYSSFRQQVRGGSQGKTAQFELAYMNHVSLAFSLLYAVKINDYYLCGACLSKIVNCRK